MYESVGCHVKLPTEPSLGYSPGPAGNLADCNAKCQLENLNKDLTGENAYDRFAVSPPLNTPGPDVNCICMRNITKALTTTVAPALCSTDCPLNPKEKCGWKKDADPQARQGSASTRSTTLRVSQPHASHALRSPQLSQKRKPQSVMEVSTHRSPSQDTGRHRRIQPNSSSAWY